MRFLLLFLLALTIAPAAIQQPAKPLSPIGRWQVKFKLVETPEKNLVFTAQEGGEGTFQLLDTAPDNKPVPGLQAAAWSLTNSNLSVSGEAELPTGTCCRETGTLILKAKFTSDSTISGKLIFVTNIDEDESPYKYHATVGTFSAVRLPKS